MGHESDDEPGELVQSASAVGGALAGTALTLVAGPFVGSASGELTARVLLRIGAEIEKRLLGPRQEQRIAEAYRVTADAIAERLNAGEPPRSDGFFEPTDHGDSAADELLEGVLLTAADEWEARKVPYIARLFSSVSFDPSVSVPESTYLLKLADRLTYRQFTLLSFWAAAQEDRYQEALAALGIDQDWQGGQPTATLAAEMDELASAGLLGVTRSDGTIGTPEPTFGGIADVGSLKGTDLTTVRLTPMGTRLWRLTGLDLVPADDLDEVMRAIRGEE